MKTLQGTEESSLQFCVDREIVTSIGAVVDTTIAESDQGRPRTWIIYPTTPRHCESIESYGVAYNRVLIKAQKLKPTKHSVFCWS